MIYLSTALRKDPNSTTLPVLKRLNNFISIHHIHSKIWVLIVSLNPYLLYIWFRIQYILNDFEEEKYFIEGEWRRRNNFGVDTYGFMSLNLFRLDKWKKTVEFGILMSHFFWFLWNLRGGFEILNSSYNKSIKIWNEKKIHLSVWRVTMSHNYYALTISCACCRLLLVSSSLLKKRPNKFRILDTQIQKKKQKITRW